MPDIAMCANDKCPMANRCYRHEATPAAAGQVFARFAPDSEGQCEYFIPILRTGKRPDAIRPKDDEPDDFTKGNY